MTVEECLMLSIQKNEEGVRLDKILSDRFQDHSRSYFQYLIENEFVLHKSRPIKKKDCFLEGDEISITFQALPEPSIAAEEIPLSILYEDDYLIAINKPSGLVVHPGVGNPSGTLVNALMHYLKNLPEADDPLRPGIIHRLDKETSGVIIVAKTHQVLAMMVDLFKERLVEKVYLAITERAPQVETVDLFMGRHPKKREEMAVLQEGGKHSFTTFVTLDENGTQAFVEARPKTGRTHQIRVHLKHVHAPIVGDTVYGSLTTPAPRVMLHAHQIQFMHPVLKKEIVINAEIPDDFDFLMKKLSLKPKMSRKISSFFIS